MLKISKWPINIFLKINENCAWLKLRVRLFPSNCIGEVVCVQACWIVHKLLCMQAMETRRCRMVQARCIIKTFRWWCRNRHTVLSLCAQCEHMACELGCSGQAVPTQQCYSINAYQRCGQSLCWPAVIESTEHATSITTTHYTVQKFGAVKLYIYIYIFFIFFIQQGCNKLIKSDSKGCYDVIKDLYFK